MSEPLSSAVFFSPNGVPADVFGVDCFWFVDCYDLRVEVSSTQHACVPPPVGVLLELRVHLLHMFVPVSRVWEVD